MAYEIKPGGPGVRIPLHYKGESYPLGSTIQEEGVNFSLFCKHGTAVTLLFFDHPEDIEPTREIPLLPGQHKSYHYWHVFVPGIRSGQLYGYRIDGPWNPDKGMRYDPGKILVDPYAKAVALPRNFQRSAFCPLGKPSMPSMKSVVADLTSYDWEGDRHLRRPFSQTILYEMHVGGLTKHKTAGLRSSKPGSFRAVCEKIPYLLDLGITAVELMPVFQFDSQDAPEGLVNYWGYTPVSFFAPHQGFSSSPDEPLAVLDEFRDMVKALHAAGLEVVLDVVYNHTTENDAAGPTYCYRGIDNPVYYILEQKDFSYANYSGCGNTLNANQSIVRRMIMDSLHFWVTEMHVDGFRFDLASILARDEKGNILSNPPLLWDIESDPIFSGVKLIAEAWDAAGLYQVGEFVGDSWKEWNGRFRDDVRRFMRGDRSSLSPMVTRLVGSPDIYGHKEREPEQSINFVTCHDGFTLNDLVSYNQKHNEGNKEQSRDGNNNNLSWNCGVEGATDDLAIEALRNRQVKNFLVLTLLSIGAPMMLMGDEIRRTQLGNNNAYCQDNETSWMDWSLMEKHADVFRFAQELIRIRLSRESSFPDFSMSLNRLLASTEINWHGVKLFQPDWSDNSHSIAFSYKSISGKLESHFIINAFHGALSFELPPAVEAPWRKWIDTSLPSPHDICYPAELLQAGQSHYMAPPHSIIVLVRSLGGQP